jgi:hypothetical protein
LLKNWGEWLTVIITGSLVPVIYEIYRHQCGEVAVLVVNVGWWDAHSQIHLKDTVNWSQAR